jgi:hypothetical protein
MTKPFRGKINIDIRDSVVDLEREAVAMLSGE